MATSIVTPNQPVPVFAPDGTIRSIPGNQLPDAISAGGKLAVQMKAPDGSLRYIPHDQVAVARAAGGEIADNQGTPDNVKPKEGFWHSLGSLFGITPEAMQASRDEYERRGGGIDAAFQMSKAAVNPHPIDMVTNAAKATTTEFKKGTAEGEQSYDALKRGDIKAFLAYQIGQVGYAGSTLAAPIFGNNISKAGEQLGEGNVSGALGTTTGVVAPIVVGGAIKGKPPAPKVEIPNVFEGQPPAEIPQGNPVNPPGIINRAATAMATPKLPPGTEYIPGIGKLSLAQKLASYVAKKTTPGAAEQVPVYGNAANAETRAPYQPYQGDLSVQPGSGPKIELPQPEQTAQPPKTSQVLKDAGVTKAMKDAGVAAPSASMNPVRAKTGSLGISGSLAPRSDIQFPPGLSGEDAAMMQLTRYNITELRAGAMKRGLPVSASDTHSTLINKIADSMTPEETQAFTGAAQASKVVPSKFPENNLMAQNLNDAAAQLQAQKGSPYEVASLRNAANTIQQYPKTLSDIDFSAEKIKGIDKRITKRIQDFMEQQKVVPEDGPQVPNGNESGPGSQFDLLMRSLAKGKGAGTP